MKILGISCSPRKDGNTEILIKEALKSAGHQNVDTMFLTVRNRELSPCDGCQTCHGKSECHIKDDMQEIYSKMLDADGIIWGTPVYVYNVSAQAKILIDRSIALGNKLANKVGGAISVAGSLGCESVWNQFNAFFSTRHMISADFVYGYAGDKGEILKDRHAMAAANELGRQMVLLCERASKFPEEYDVPIYRYVMKEHGIHMCPAKGRFKEQD